MAAPTGSPFHNATIHGTGAPVPERLSIPYHGEQLVGQQLLAQIAEWEEQGSVEPSHANAIRLVKANPAWLDLSDQTFVLLGAGAEMGPLLSLLRYGANVVAIDIKDTAVWRRLLKLACLSHGTLHFPLHTVPDKGMRDDELAQLAGCDLLSETPQIAAWLAGFSGPLTIGSYAYLDGTKHVRVALAMDAIIDHLLATRDDVSLAYLLTPTDVYVVPQEAAEVAMARYAEWKTTHVWRNPKIWQESLHALMAALLIHDLFNPNAASNPAVALAHPYELFMQGAAHNGLWRTGFRARSVLEIAAVLGWRHAQRNG